MSQAPGAAIDRSQSTNTTSERVTERSTSPSSHNQELLLSKHSEKLRHVFPRASRHSVLYDRATSSRISKIDAHKGPFPYRRQLKSRGAFHRVISSFFGNVPTRRAQASNEQARSRASSSGSLPGSSVLGSVPSLDLMSPGTFIFSGPSLRPAGSCSNSTPRHRSLMGSFGDGRPSRRIRSDSFSVVDNISVQTESFEPSLGQEVARSISDVVLGASTSVEEHNNTFIEDPNGNNTLTIASPVQITASPNSLSGLHISPRKHDFFQDLAILKCISYHLDSKTQESFKLACRLCHKSIKSVQPPLCPASSKLPNEILVYILTLLDPKTFNAARHTCRDWMAASLNTTLLKTMLIRGGWQSCCETAQGCSIATTSLEWNLSRTLSRQCALASHWTGNGLDDRSTVIGHTDIDFSELANGHGLLLTSSICGKFLMVAKDTLIRIYGMEDGLLQPLTSVVCPRRVLAMSMNASVGRGAVAALLEGRMGMVCELRYGRPNLQGATSSGDTYVKGDGYIPWMNTQPIVITGDTHDLDNAINSTETTLSRVLQRCTFVQDPALDTFNAIELKAHSQGFNLGDTDDDSTHERHLINRTWNLDLRGPIEALTANSKTKPTAQSVPLGTGTSTFYRHLCSEDDPPRNVAICPQRRCVAYGCSAGIELHWIDALTGQSLSRWFPLTLPSDHLYFLSPRLGLESSKKLRLISSAAHPVQRLAINRGLPKIQISSPFWGSFKCETRTQQTQDCDHYNAIPLSDGHHVIFIDPSNDRLVLGCDAPLGGPAKLIRKVVLVPPKERVGPRIYTTAVDMSSGARIVAVFGDTVMLYSVPPDVLALSRLEQTAESGDVNIPTSFDSKVQDSNHWLNWWDEPPVFDPAERLGTDDSNTVWPILLSGMEIAILPDICELAVQTRPDILIWAFTCTSQCKTWRLHNFVDRIVRSKQVVGRDGLIYGISVEGSNDDSKYGADIFTTSSDSRRAGVDEEQCEKLGGKKPQEVGCNDQTSGFFKVVPRALAVENDKWVDCIDVMSCADAWFESGGDVVTWHEL